MHAHRIEVLDRADDHDVVRQVAHHLQLKFFPAEDRLFNQHFVNWRRSEPTANYFFKLFRIVGSAATGSTERKRWPDDGRIISLLNDLFCFIKRLCETAARHLEPRFVHGLLKQQTILSDFDRVAFRADHFDAILTKHACILKRDREIERRLSTDCWQEGIRTFASNYFCD